jgi:hypothetical protein
MSSAPIGVPGQSRSLIGEKDMNFESLSVIFLTIGRVVKSRSCEALRCGNRQISLYYNSFQY